MWYKKREGEGKGRKGRGREEKGEGHRRVELTWN